MAQPPKKKSLDDIFGPPKPSSSKSLDDIFATPSAEPTVAQKAAETVQDIMAAGLSNIPGAPTMYGALTAARTLGKKSIKEGAQEFQEMVRQAPQRERYGNWGGAISGPYSPAAVAGSVVPYVLPGGQATRMGRALYSAGVGGGRELERSLVEGESLSDAAKDAALSAGIESAFGFFGGEPAGAVARAARTPSRTAQVAAQKAATREAEAPLYQAWTGYTKGQPVTSAPLSPPTKELSQALNTTLVKQALRVVRKNPEFEKLPVTSPVVLDRIYKVVGSKAFKEKYSVDAEAAQVVRDLLKTGMVTSRPNFPYTEVLGVASKGRQIGKAIERGAETARQSASSSPGSLLTALRRGEESFAEYLKNASPEERAAAVEGVYGFLNEAPKLAKIPMTKFSLPLPSRAAKSAPRLMEIAGGRPTMLQRLVRGGIATAPTVGYNSLRAMFEDDQ